MPEPDEQQPDSTRRSQRLAKRPRVEYEGLDTVTPPRPQDSDPSPGNLAKKPRQDKTKKKKAAKNTSKDPAGAKNKRRKKRRDAKTVYAVKTYFNKDTIFWHLPPL